MLGGSHGFLFYLRGIKQVKQLWGRSQFCVFSYLEQTQKWSALVFVLLEEIRFILCQIHRIKPASKKFSLTIL